MEEHSTNLKGIQLGRVVLPFLIYFLHMISFLLAKLQNMRLKCFTEASPLIFNAQVSPLRLKNPMSTSVKMFPHPYNTKFFTHWAFLKDPLRPHILDYPFSFPAQSMKPFSPSNRNWNLKWLVGKLNFFHKLDVPNLSNPWLPPFLLTRCLHISSPNPFVMNWIIYKKNFGGAFPLNLIT